MLSSKQHPRILYRRLRAHGRHFPANRQKAPEAARVRAKEPHVGRRHRNVITITALILLPGHKPVKPFMIFLFFIEPATIGFPAMLLTAAGMR